MVVFAVLLALVDALCSVFARVVDALCTSCRGTLLVTLLVRCTLLVFGRMLCLYFANAAPILKREAFSLSYSCLNNTLIFDKVVLINKETYRL